MISPNVGARFIAPSWAIPAWLCGTEAGAMNCAELGAMNCAPTVIMPWMWLGMTTKESKDTVGNRLDNPTHDALAIRPVSLRTISPSEMSPNKQSRLRVTIVTKYAPDCL